MIFRSLRFRKPLAWLAFILLAAPLWAAPDAESILQAARMNPLGQQTSLRAQLRVGSVTTPFLITVDGAVHYIFTDPSQELILELNEDGPVLTERLGDKTSTVKPARFDDSLRRSGLSYEDLSLQFLYWKHPKILGEETFSGNIRTWKIEVQAPRGTSQYGVARLWIDQQSGALMQVEGYNLDGKMTRRFMVISAQKLDGQWMLKQMRIETLDPETKKITNRTYLEVLGLNK